VHINPKTGIARFGPRSWQTKSHPAGIRIGVIGTAQTVEKAQRWIEANAEGVEGNESHLAFPGFAADRGFFFTLEFDDRWPERITQSEAQTLLGITYQRQRFEAAVGLLDEKVRLLAERDQRVDCIIVALPDDLYRRCHVADYKDPIIGSVHRDLRRAFKATVMRHRIPTQILRQRTVEGREADHPSKIAWNFFTGLYFKAGGIP
jgi:hypothetical protein